MTRTDAHIPPLLSVTALTFLPYIRYLPLWVSVWCALAWITTLWIVRRRGRRPGRTLRRVLTLGGIAAVLLTNSLSIDRNAGIAMLWIMASVKPMEIDSRRDLVVAIFLAYFLAVTVLFYTTSLTVGLYVVSTVICITAVLVRINQPRGRWRQSLVLAVRLGGQALPIALVLFLLFPRIQGGLWGRHNPATAVSGFSDRLVPGAVSYLVRSDAVAFRAEFEDNLPEPAQRYWRGVTFWHTDGRAWTRMEGNYGLSHPIRSYTTIDYTITLEPHGKPWLFALDLPLQSAAGTRLRSDHTLVNRWDVNRRKRYAVRSALEYDTGPLWQWELAALDIPPGSNPQAVALARRWREAARKPEDVVRSALHYFSNRAFSYTLNPPLLGEDAVDDFLFEARRGYCEHFASAFAFLMRAGRIPARVVGGYLGGDVNPYGRYLIVRQSHAHTWVEVWLTDKGWVRIDPTLVVVPGRVDQGVSAVLAPEERTALGAFEGWKPFQTVWRHLVFGWDALDNQWNKWVLGYSRHRQRSLLSRLGIDMRSWKGRAQSLMIAVLTIGLLAFLQVWRSLRRGGGEPDAVQQIYLDFCEKLARCGWKRQGYQGPLAVYRMVPSTRPELKNTVWEITQLYIRLRYMPDSDVRSLRRFRRRVKGFKIRGACSL